MLLSYNYVLLLQMESNETYFIIIYSLMKLSKMIFGTILLSSVSNPHWICIGYFNEVLNQNEKKVTLFSILGITYSKIL